ncbi:MAG: hypothetical protein RLN81_12805 [Balneolaceae bacterium]
MLKKLLKVSVISLLFPLLGMIIFPIESMLSTLYGLILSSISILVSAWIIDHFWEKEWEVFGKVFFLSLIVRFVVVLIFFAIILKVIKIDEIYFTVSFIISYLCYSITEMIFFNKFLEKKSSNK